MDEFRDHLDARWLAAMRLSRDAQAVRDERHGRERDTAMGAWKKRWWDWGCRDASELSSYFSNTDSTYVYCNEEVEYKRTLGAIVADICSISKNDWSFVLNVVLAILRPYN